MINRLTLLSSKNTPNTMFKCDHVFIYVAATNILIILRSTINDSFANFLFFSE